MATRALALVPLGVMVVAALSCGGAPALGPSPDHDQVGDECREHLECVGTDHCVRGFCVADPQPDAFFHNESDPADVPELGCTTWPRPELEPRLGAGDVPFPIGTTAVAVRETRATLVARVEGPHRARAHYTAGPGCETETTTWVEPSSAADGLVHLELTGLVPGSHYRYQLELEGSDELTSPGYLRTAPARDSSARIAFSADIAHREGFYGLFDDLTDAAPDLYLSLGDWPYADSGTPAHRLNEFRYKHADARRGPLIRMWMRSTGIHAIWDDHEVTNDWDGRISDRSERLVEDAITAWNELFPVLDAPAGEIYRAHRWGPNLHLFYLDLRSHRGSNLAADGPAKSMMGEAQRTWFFEELEKSDSTFKLVAMSVPFAFGTTGNDHWEGFRHERDAILDFIESRRIRGVVFLTGDQHWLAVHHMPSGHKAYQTGALAQIPRRPLEQVPRWVTKQHKALNFGLLDYDPGPPATLTFRGVGNQRESREDTDDPGELYHESFEAGWGDLYVPATEVPLEWIVRGAHTYAGHGARQITNAPPGEYWIEWLAPDGRDVVTTSERLRLRHEGKVTFPGPDEARIPELESWESFSDPTDADKGPVGQIDACQASEDGASWTVVDGELRVDGVCTDAEDAPAEAGARRAWRKKRWRKRSLRVKRFGSARRVAGVSTPESTVSFRVRPSTEGAFGLMYAVSDENVPDQYYRLVIDPKREYLRWVRTIDGETRLLEENRRFQQPTEYWMTVAIVRSGPSHELFIDGRRVAAIEDDRLSSGGLALYGFGDLGASFDNVVVRSHATEAPE